MKKLIAMRKLFDYQLKFILSLLLVAGGFMPMAHAQQSKTDAHIYGHVLDKATDEHLPYVNVVIVRVDADGHHKQVLGAATNESGHYYLNNVPEGSFLLTVTMVGYRKQEIPVTVRRGSSLEVNVVLEPNATRLKDVVVSANRCEVDRHEAATVVNVISPATFENTNSCNLAEGLNYQSGLRVENTCQNCGVNSVRINGLDGKYSQILIDSRPVFSSLAGVYGLEQIPASMIDRVEVIRGGGSALFGANAIGGVINIITREPVKNSLTMSHTVSNLEGKAWDNNTSLGAALVSANHKAGAYIFGTTRTRQGFDHDGDGFTELGKLRSMSVGMRGYYKITNQSKVTVEYHNTHEFRRGGDSIDLLPHQVTVAEQAEHNIHGGSVSYDFISEDTRQHLSVFTSLQSIARSTYYGTQYDINAYGTSDDFSSVSGVQYNYAFDRLLFMPAQLVGGVEYSYNQLKDVQLAYNRVLQQDIRIASAFLQNEWKNDRFGLLVGLRADKHNLVDDPVLSPRANLRYTFLDHFALRASYSSGFRAPQAFDEDLHIMAVGGQVSIISLSPDLRPEYSSSFCASVGWDREVGDCDIDLLMEGFYTTLDDVFVLRENGFDVDGNLLLERCNGSGAFVEGINLEASATWRSGLGLQCGFTFQRSRYKEDETWSDNPAIAPQRRMFRTPDYYGYLTADYTLFATFKIALSGTYTGPMLVQHFAGYVPEDVEVLTPSFFDLNVKLSYDFQLAASTTLQLNGGVQNIFNSYQNDFDQGSLRDAGYIYGPNLPRTVFLGAKLSL